MFKPSDNIALVFLKKGILGKMGIVVPLLLNFYRKYWVITNKSISCFVIIIILNQLHKVDKGISRFMAPALSPPWPSMVIAFEMEKCKTKPIQADIGIFTYILVYSCIFRDI